MATNRYEEIKQALEAAEADFEKFYDKGVASAGARVRKALQNVTALAKDIRKDVTEVKNARKAEKE
jgi:hypothetical protein